jgi:hypothetical protein
MCYINYCRSHGVFLQKGLEKKKKDNGSVLYGPTGCLYLSQSLFDWTDGSVGKSRRQSSKRCNDYFLKYIKIILFYFLKFIFNINISKQFKNIKKLI